MGLGLVLADYTTRPHYLLCNLLMDVSKVTLYTGKTMFSLTLSLFVLLIIGVLVLLGQNRIHVGAVATVSISG